MASGVEAAIYCIQVAFALTDKQALLVIEPLKQTSSDSVSVGQGAQQRVTLCPQVGRGHPGRLLGLLAAQALGYQTADLSHRITHSMRVGYSWAPLMYRPTPVAARALVASTTR